MKITSNIAEELCIYNHALLISGRNAIIKIYGNVFYVEPRIINGDVLHPDCYKNFKTIKEAYEYATKSILNGE